MMSASNSSLSECVSPSDEDCIRGEKRSPCFSDFDSDGGHENVSRRTGAPPRKGCAGNDRGPNSARTEARAEEDVNMDDDKDEDEYRSPDLSFDLDKETKTDEDKDEDGYPSQEHSSELEKEATAEQKKDVMQCDAIAGFENKGSSGSGELFVKPIHALRRSKRLRDVKKVAAAITKKAKTNKRKIQVKRGEEDEFLGLDK